MDGQTTQVDGRRARRLTVAQAQLGFASETRFLRHAHAHLASVSYYLQASQSGEETEIHVPNRSLARPGDERLLRSSEDYERFYVGVLTSGLPPCIEEVFDTRKVSMYATKDWAGRKHGEHYSETRTNFVYLAFVDSHGKEWVRSEIDLRYQLKVRDTIRGYVEMGRTPARKADACGDDRG
ncbi:hypothetical protein OHB05_38590 [Streptomyces sp. NBC_00638]|uniref:hypothetical protein n=1 Tax=Streptomyces sp. NBC_00638 TaxID=2975794 RepID=UPI00225C0688|nr:hypothetical protein [Streptomyces sp. NBC_00638]MCX5008475.1 hypothetical protein [Streptomyces sp. NBC_00638]